MNRSGIIGIIFVGLFALLAGFMGGAAVAQRQEKKDIQTFLGK